MHVKVKDFISENNFIAKDELGHDTLLFEEGLLDSMGFVSLISFLEEEFGVLPNDDELVEENFESINAIAGFIERKLVPKV